MLIFFSGNENIQAENVGSDDEADRKGMTRDKIRDWIKDVNLYIGHFETTIGHWLKNLNISNLRVNLIS